MSGSYAGAIKGAAAKLGITVDEYERNVADGLKWCRACRGWHPRAKFGLDGSRGDGLSAVCRASKAQPKKPRHKQRTLVALRRVEARDGDVKQARRTVNAHVEAGRWPHPNELPCADCAHRWASGERRHEYDHHLGYMGEKRRALVERHGYDTKNAAHLIRLLRQGIEFLNDGAMTVQRYDATELLAIKHGEWSLERVKDEATRLFRRAEDAYDRSSLPVRPDRRRVEELCAEVVQRALDERSTEASVAA